MYKKLRWKFMWMSTLILLLVIGLVTTLMYRVSVATIMTQTRVLMEEIMDNDGELPGQGEFEPGKKAFASLNQESIYEIRYFTVIIDEEHSRITHKNIAIREEDAIDIAEQLCKSKRDYGSASVFGRRMINFLKQTREDGSVFIVILDSTSRYALIRVVTLCLSFLWLAVMMLYVILMWRFSGKLIRPFIENEERQKRFITNASHELKTPLAVISSNTEMTEAMGGKTKWTESTRRQTKKLQTLIEDLVVLAKLDEMDSLALTELDISALVTEALDPYKTVIEGSGRRFMTQIPSKVEARTEKRSLLQLISILLDNASKYCDEGGEVRVTLESITRGKSARLTVSNTYAASDVDTSRFFERFYREDTSHNTAVAGFGIGLSMASEIAERLGGSLSATHSGDMITFTLTFGRVK